MTTPSRHRTARVRSVLVLLLVAAVAGSGLAAAVTARAGALPPVCDDTECPPDPDPITYTYTSTLSVAPPSVGVITGSSPGSANVLDCRPAGAGTCSVTDTIETTSPRRPAGGWPTYTLRASDGPAGYAFRWREGCNATGDCVATNNKESASDVGGGWIDVAVPEILTLDVPASASHDTPLRAVARDNDRVSTYHWMTCTADFVTCDREYIGPADVYTLGPRQGGSWQILLRVGDPAGNWSEWASEKTEYDATPPSVSITSPQAGGWTGQHAEVTFTSGDNAGGVTTSCAVDGGALRQCSSPFSFVVGDYGTHVVRVVVTDIAGNTSSADRTFRAVARQLRPETDVPPTYGRAWTVVFGSVAADATGVFRVTDRGSGTLLCSGPAGSSHTGSCAVSGTALRPGVHTIDVRYTGDHQNPSASGSFTTTVQRPAAPGTSLIVMAPATRYGTAHPLIASSLPRSATGTVDFTAAGRFLCRAVVRTGAAKCFAAATALRAGVHTVQAVFSDPVWPRQHAATRLVVAKGVTRLTVRAGSARLHRRTTLTAVGLPASATGRVTFKTGRKTLCTGVVRAGRASCSTAVERASKRIVVRARYNGDANWLPGVSKRAYRVTA